MRIAVVHDWLYIFGGAERVLQSILRCVPGADLFVLFDVLDAADRAEIGVNQVHTSFLQRMPGIARRHRLYLPLMPLAIEQLDLGEYDLVISSSYAVAKGVLTGPDQLHLAYVHSPMRYAWDLQHQYLRESKLTRGLKSAFARLLLYHMRIWDTRTANGINAYAVNSHFVGRRVLKAYGRTARVIYPPVRVPSTLASDGPRGDFFMTASRLVPYKNVRAIVEAFNLLPDQQLVVAGTGPELARLTDIAGSNIRFAGFVPDAELADLMRRARAFVFAAEEDFGIVPVEAQAHGTPVIALGRGGSRETIITEGLHPTGVFFETATAEAIVSAVRQFIGNEHAFSPHACHANALRFGEARFQSEFASFIDEQLAAFALLTGAGCNVRPTVDGPAMQAPLP